MDKRRPSRQHNHRPAAPTGKARARGAGMAATMPGRSHVYKDKKRMPPPEDVEIQEQLLG